MKRKAAIQKKGPGGNSSSTNNIFPVPLAYGGVDPTRPLEIKNLHQTKELADEQDQGRL